MTTTPHPNHAVAHAAWPKAAVEDDLTADVAARDPATDEQAPDEFAWWRHALAGTIGPIHENEPQPGYYRVRESKAGPFLAVALWREKGEMRALKQGRPADAGALWTWC